MQLQQAGACCVISTWFKSPTAESAHGISQHSTQQHRAHSTIPPILPMVAEDTKKTFTPLFDLTKQPESPV
jgi:hypothetical protein